MSVQSGVIFNCIVAHVKLQVFTLESPVGFTVILHLNNQSANTHSAE